MSNAGSSSPGQSYVEPRTRTEKTLVEIWRDILGVERVGIGDNFFDLAGDSFLAAQIIEKIEQVFKKSLPNSTLIHVQTVAELATLLDEGGGEEPTGKYLVALRAGGSRPPFFCIPPSAMLPIKLQKLAEHLADPWPLYSFEYKGMDGKEAPQTRMDDIAQTMLEEVKRIQPEGPYYLGGLCFGGNVAFVMAQQLRAQGDQVAFLGIIDSNYAPGPRRPIRYYFYRLHKVWDRLVSRKESGIPDVRKYSSRRTRFVYPENEALYQRFQTVYNAHIIAQISHTSPPYPGKIVRFSTDWIVAHRATRHWRKATSMELENHIIPGIHFRAGQRNDSFLDEPYVQILAEKLSTCLERAYQEATSEQASRPFLSQAAR